MQSTHESSTARVLISSASLCLATVLWLTLVHLLFRPAKFTAGPISPDAQFLSAAQLRFWGDPTLKTQQLDAMRRSNSEWDFMGRTFLALALAEMCEREPNLRNAYLPVIDTIIDETLALEKQRGMHFFLMPYSKSRPYLQEPERSLFIDGEVALMLATRRVVAEKPSYKELFASRVKLIEERLNRNALMAAESYPDECWLFDHSLALAALRIGDFLDGTDHIDLCAKWVTIARQKLTDPKTGIIVSSYTTRCDWLDGPEGSSIWGAAHFLKFVDEDLARDQYARARKEIGRTFLGFGWSREWPLSWRNQLDVDSGAVVPFVDASAGASGTALIAAASFGDSDFLSALKTSLNFAAFPVRNHGALRYSASNAVGDAAMLYAETLGAIYTKVTATNSKKRP